MQIFVGGAPVAASLRREIFPDTTGATGSVENATMARVTVDGATAIEWRASYVSSVYTINERQIMVALTS
jgi:hypothetical protein